MKTRKTIIGLSLLAMLILASCSHNMFGCKYMKHFSNDVRMGLAGGGKYHGRH